MESLPGEILNDVGIREENLTFGMILKMFSALREKSKEDGHVYHEEMRGATEFNKELITSENRHKNAAREVEPKNKGLREEITQRKP